MIDGLDKLSPPEKRVAAKTFSRLGWGSRKIEEWLDVDHVSVSRYAKEDTPEDLKQFETDFETAIQDAKRQGLALAHKRLIELIPKERRLDQLVRTAEYFEGISRAKTEVKVNNLAVANAENKGMSDEHLAQYLFKLLQDIQTRQGQPAAVVDVQVEPGEQTS